VFEEILKKLTLTPVVFWQYCAHH